VRTIGEHRRDRRRYEHRPRRAVAEQAGGTVDGGAEQVAVTRHHRAGVDRRTHAQGVGAPPRRTGDPPLELHGGPHRVERVAERRHRAIAGVLEQRPLVRGHDRSHQVVVHLEVSRHRLLVLRPPPSRVDDVSQEQRHHRHRSRLGGPPSAVPRSWTAPCAARAGIVQPAGSVSEHDGDRLPRAHSGRVCRPCSPGEFAPGVGMNHDRRVRDEMTTTTGLPSRAPSTSEAIHPTIGVGVPPQSNTFRRDDFDTITREQRSPPEPLQA
jgi:hypothetical protein